ncbi:NnrU family protein [Gemmobacter nectariphilus]|uniref:NnrU family protein n=1 Tax=Gemmobacter nectariphilus TaxID=220343 RepID=UPI00041DDA9A|nr:NnrU family protein [Gemmobacter nectariphilus]
MEGWGEYAFAWAVFLLTHAIPARPALKARLTGALGRAGYGLAYSLVSVAALAWLIVAAGRAPYVEIWAWAPWQVHVTQAAMALACLIAALGLGAPNPFSFGGARNARFDPARPGIVGLTRHPVLAALALWAAGHMVPNGDLAHVLMLGGFAGFAALGMVVIDRRRQRVMGPDWHRLQPARTLLGAGNPWRWLAAGAAWWALAMLHPIVIGPAVV